MSAERLMLIEDDEATREVLTLLLEADGWTVRALDSGEAALEVLQVEGEACPQVVLCDLHLPGLQGAALAAALRPLLQDAALLAMSASDAGTEGAGYDAMLRKPFGPAEVRKALERLASRAGGEPDAAGDAAESRSKAAVELPVVAMETFQKLQQQMGARTKDLYAFALADAGDRLRRMERSLADGDVPLYRTEAHQLKGSAGMIGAQRLATLAGAAELDPADVFDKEPVEALRKQKVEEMWLASDEIRLMLETLFPI